MRRIKSTVVAGVATLLIAGVVVTSHPFAEAAHDNATPAAGASQDDEHGNTTSVVGTPLLQPAIDLIAAQQAALAGRAGAVVTVIELNGDDGALIYDVTLSNGMDVSVDATTGKVLATERADNNGQNGDNQVEDNGGDNHGDAENGNNEDGNNDNGNGDNDSQG